LNVCEIYLFKLIIFHQLEIQGDIFIQWVVILIAKVQFEAGKNNGWVEEHRNMDYLGEILEVKLLIFVLFIH
jgi:hypothetical protein